MDIYTYVVYAMIAGFVLVFWKAAQWAMSSSKTSKIAESLTPADLEALREACEELVADLRAAADEASVRLEASIRRAELVASKLDNAPQVESMTAAAVKQHQQEKIELKQAAAASVQAVAEAAAEQTVLAQTHDIEPVNEVERIYWLADQGVSAGEIARRENRSVGEIKLILDLRALQQKQVA